MCEIADEIEVRLFTLAHGGKDFVSSVWHEEC